MCHLISVVSSYISGVLRNMKSSMLLVVALFISSFAVVAQAEDINLTVAAPEGSSSVRVTGPWWGWDPNGGPEATSNGDGTWSVALSPTENMEYLWVVDGSQENLIDNAANAECTADIDGGSLITDYSGYANRVWVLGTGDATNTYDACAPAAPEPEPTGVNLVLTTDGAAVRLTGPWWGWDPNGGPEASDNGDGTWTVTLDPAPTDNMEYLWVVDGVQENLVDNAANAECAAEIDGGALITDYANYANRVHVVDSGDAANTYDACAGTAAPEPEPTGVNLVLTTDGAAVRLTGPWWGWDPNGGPEASDNGDGTWTVTLDPAPTENMEYLWVVDGVQENLIDNAANAECTAEIDGGSLITDYSGWANRVLVVDSGDAANTYDSCAGTAAPEPEPEVVNLVLTTDGAAVRLTGPWWGWDPNGGPEASDNGDGTWTVTLDPAPTDNMEYLWVVDGVQENLVDNAANAECAAEIDGGALITDYANYANRVHVVDSGDAANTYDSCAGTAAPEPEPEVVNLVLTTDGAAVRLTGPWWSWDPNGGPEASDNGDGTWTVTLNPAPTDNMEYLWVVDGVQENLVDNAANAECSAEIDGGALITDYANYANRVHVVDSGDAANTYDSCAGTAAPEPEPEVVNLVLTTDGAAVRLTGPWWSWDPNGGPEASDNGDGTWTVTLNPAPTDNMEYLWVVDGVQENLVDNAANAECSAEIDGGALITDYANYANRVHVVDSGDAANTYDACAGTAATDPEPEPNSRRWFRDY